MIYNHEMIKVKDLASLNGEINFLCFQFQDISRWTNIMNNSKSKAVIKEGWTVQVRFNKHILGNL